MDIHDIILIIVASLEFFLGFYILFRKPKTHISISFSLFIFSVAFWGLGIALFRGLGNINIAFFWAKIYYLAAALIASNFVYFSLVFPFQTSEFRPWKKIATIAPGIIILLVLIFTPWQTQEVQIREWGKEVILGPFYHVYCLYFLIYWFWGLYNLFKKYSNSDGIHRWQLKYFLWGACASSTFGITFNLILPWLGNYRLIMIGPELSLVWLWFTTYIILKK